MVRVQGRVAALVVALLVAGPLGAPAVTASAGTRVEPTAKLAAEAYVWGYPLVVTERTLQTFGRLLPSNRLTFQRARSDVTSRLVVAPNTDTLYAVAPLDLRGEPYVLTVPEIRDRYYSFQFISAYTDSFAYVGTRATDGRAGRWAITPPGWDGRLPAGVERLRSPTPQVFLLGRFLATDDADVANVRALQDQVTLESLSTLTGDEPAPAPAPFAAPAGTPQTVADTGAAFFDELGDALAINPPSTARERRLLRRFAALGIGPGKHPSTDADSEVQAALAAGAEQGEATITAGAGERGAQPGWSVRTDVGRYRNDDRLRAVVAKVGWGANVPAEAMYAATASADDGSRLTGANSYVIHFDGDKLPPVKAFWSMTLYGPDRFFVDNPIDRYAVGDRTAGLEYGADGSLDVYVGHTAPAGHESNWLPAPDGPFQLTLRLYLPKRAALDGSYDYPTVTATPAAGP